MADVLLDGDSGGQITLAASRWRSPFNRKSLRTRLPLLSWLGAGRAGDRKLRVCGTHRHLVYARLVRCPQAIVLVALIGSCGKRPTPRPDDTSACLAAGTQADVAAWTAAGRPHVMLRPTAGGVRIVTSPGSERVCAVDCISPARIYVNDNTARCGPAATTVRDSATMPAAADGALTADICKDPPCGPHSGGDDDDSGQNHPLPVTPLFGVQLSLDVDISDQIRAMAEPIVGGSPFVLKHGTVFGVWDHSPSSNEDFQSGMSGFGHVIATGETLAVFLTPALLTMKAQAATSSASALSTNAPDQLTGSVTMTCQAGLCPLTLSADVRMHVAASNGAVTVSQPETSHINVDPGSIVCIVLEGGLLGLAGNCIPVLTGSRGLGSAFDQLPREVQLAPNVSLHLDYVRVAAITDRALVIGAVVR